MRNARLADANPPPTIHLTSFDSRASNLASIVLHRAAQLSILSSAMLATADSILAIRTSRGSRWQLNPVECIGDGERDRDQGADRAEGPDRRPDAGDARAHLDAQRANLPLRFRNVVIGRIYFVFEFGVYGFGVGVDLAVELIELGLCSPARSSRSLRRVCRAWLRVCRVSHPWLWWFRPSCR
jgi:hypothetical protein